MQLKIEDRSQGTFMGQTDGLQMQRCTNSIYDHIPTLHELSC